MRRFCAGCPVAWLLWHAEELNWGKEEAGMECVPHISATSWQTEQRKREGGPKEPRANALSTDKASYSWIGGQVIMLKKRYAENLVC